MSDNTDNVTVTTDNVTTDNVAVTDTETTCTTFYELKFSDDFPVDIILSLKCQLCDHQVAADTEKEDFSRTWFVCKGCCDYDNPYCSSFCQDNHYKMVHYKNCHPLSEEERQFYFRKDNVQLRRNVDGSCYLFRPTPLEQNAGPKWQAPTEAATVKSSKVFSRQHSRSPKDKHDKKNSNNKNNNNGSHKLHHHRKGPSDEELLRMRRQLPGLISATSEEEGTPKEHPANSKIAKPAGPIALSKSLSKRQQMKTVRREQKPPPSQNLRSPEAISAEVVASAAVEASAVTAETEALNRPLTPDHSRGHVQSEAITAVEQENLNQSKDVKESNNTASIQLMRANDIAKKEDQSRGRPDDHLTPASREQQKNIDIPVHEQVSQPNPFKIPTDPRLRKRKREEARTAITTTATGASPVDAMKNLVPEQPIPTASVTEIPQGEVDTTLALPALVKVSELRRKHKRNREASPLETGPKVNPSKARKETPKTEEVLTKRKEADVYASGEKAMKMKEDSRSSNNTSFERKIVSIQENYKNDRRTARSPQAIKDSLSKPKGPAQEKNPGERSRYVRSPPTQKPQSPHRDQRYFEISPRRRSHSPPFHLGPQRSCSPVRHSFSPRHRRKAPRSPIRRSRSPLHQRSRSPARQRCRSPFPQRISRSRQRSSSPVRQRSRSPFRERSRSPFRQRSRSHVRQRSRSPFRQRFRSPFRQRSRSPFRQRSRSPFRQRSRSPRRRSPRRYELNSPSRERSRFRQTSRSPQRHRRSSSPRKSDQSNPPLASRSSSFLCREQQQQQRYSLGTRSSPQTSFSKEESPAIGPPATRGRVKEHGSPAAKVITPDNFPEVKAVTPEAENMFGLDFSEVTESEWQELEGDSSPVQEPPQIDKNDSEIVNENGSDTEVEETNGKREHTKSVGKATVVASFQKETPQLSVPTPKSDATKIQATQAKKKAKVSTKPPLIEEEVKEYVRTSPPRSSTFEANTRTTISPSPVRALTSDAASMSQTTSPLFDKDVAVYNLIMAESFYKIFLTTVLQDPSFQKFDHNLMMNELQLLGLPSSQGEEPKLFGMFKESGSQETLRYFYSYMEELSVPEKRVVAHKKKKKKPPLEDGSSVVKSDNKLPPLPGRLGAANPIDSSPKSVKSPKKPLVSRLGNVVEPASPVTTSMKTRTTKQPLQGRLGKKVVDTENQPTKKPPLAYRLGTFPINDQPNLKTYRRPDSVGRARVSAGRTVVNTSQLHHQQQQNEFLKLVDEKIAKFARGLTDLEKEEGQMDNDAREYCFERIANAIIDDESNGRTEVCAPVPSPHVSKTKKKKKQPVESSSGKKASVFARLGGEMCKMNQEKQE